MSSSIQVQPISTIPIWGDWPDLLDILKIFEEGGNLIKKFGEWG